MDERARGTHLDLDVHRTGNTAVVRCSGKLVAGVNDLLSHEVRQLIPVSKRIVLDLTDLTHMDSSGIGTVVRVNGIEEMDGGTARAGRRAVAKPGQEGGVASEWAEGRAAETEGSCGGRLAS